MHRSEPTNPVLAHPLFMAGYIEHLGTGTTDMIADCEALGLRTPEFIQADDFRTIIYRQEKVSDPAQKVSDPTPKVSDLDSKSIKPRPTAKQRKELDFCDETPRTAQEILDMVGVKYHTKTLDQYINKLVDADLLCPTGAKIHDSNRRYITAHPSTDQ